MSVSEDPRDTQSLKDLLVGMLQKFENEESPSFVGYDPSHPTIYMTLFKWYDNPEVLGEYLIEQYSGAAKSNTEESKRLMIATIRALNFWHNHFREDFRFNPEVIVKLREFEDLVKNDGLENFLKIDQTADDRWGRSNSLNIRKLFSLFGSFPRHEFPLMML
jgi:hypothetical protein